MKLEHYDLPWTKLEWKNHGDPLSWCKFLLWLNDLKERMMPGTYKIHNMNFSDYYDSEFIKK